MASIFKNTFLKQLMGGDMPKEREPAKPKTGIRPKPRHQGKPWTGVNRLSQNLVAKVHHIDPDMVPELDQLKKKPSGMAVLLPANIQKIIKTFNLQNLDREHPKTLGNTGIVIFYNPNVNNFCLKK